MAENTGDVPIRHRGVVWVGVHKTGGDPTDSLYIMHGVNREQFPGTSEAISQLTHPDDRARVAAAIRKSVANATPCEIEFRVIKRSRESQRRECARNEPSLPSAAIEGDHVIQIGVPIQ